MSRDQFIHYLEEPARLDGESLRHLDELVREYPFCQPAQLLFLKNLHNQENIRFNKYLKLAALYAGDRKMLYRLLSGKAVGEPAGGDQLDEIQADIMPEIEVEWDMAMKNPPEVELSPGLELEISDETPNQTEPSQSDGAGDAGKRNAYIQTIERLIPIVDIDLLLFDFPSRSEVETGQAGREQIAPDMITPDNGNEAVRNPAIPFDLLKGFLRTEPAIEPAISGEPLFFSPVVQKLGDADSPPEIPERQSRQHELIDRFVSKQDSMIIRPPVEPAVPVDLSLESLKESDDLLTETLARIYMQQGYHRKAIHAFEKLSLKYPEKSVYFASQIEKIKEIIKNQ